MLNGRTRKPGTPTAALRRIENKPSVAPRSGQKSRLHGNRLRERRFARRKGCIDCAAEMTAPRARTTTNGGIFPDGLDQRMLISRGQKALGSACYPLRVRSNESEIRKQPAASACCVRRPQSTVEFNGLGAMRQAGIACRSGCELDAVLISPIATCKRMAPASRWFIPPRTPCGREP